MNPVSIKKRDCVEGAIPRKSRIVVCQWTGAVRWTCYVPVAAARGPQGGEGLRLGHGDSGKAIISCSFETVRWHDLHSDAHITL